MAAWTLTAGLTLLLLEGVILVTGQENEFNFIMDPDEYCAERRDLEEHFRRRLPLDLPYEEYESECNYFYRCVPAQNSKRSISKQECPYLQFFDVDLQTCDIIRRVSNCDIFEKPKPPLPVWPLLNGEISLCEDGEIECGTGECLPREVYCDDFADCQDGSDENVCTSNLDPNAAPECNREQCLAGGGNFSNCYCSIDGTRIPGDINIDSTPQMILISFAGAVSERSFKIYDDIFKSTIKNKGNDCTAKATFFVTHAYSNYSAIQELHRRGHEIAVGSITNSADEEYWANIDEHTFEREMDGMRILAEKFAQIGDGSIIGVKLPLGRSGGNAQFNMMRDFHFLYDASLVASKGRLPIWPYTLDYKIPHKCFGSIKNCPSKSFKGLWELPINELDRRQNTDFDEELSKCANVPSCGYTKPNYFRNFLDNNLAHHKLTNRAPLQLSFTAAFFDSNPLLLTEFKSWLLAVTEDPSIFFVTFTQALQWISAPTELQAINSFTEWKHKCESEGQPLCAIPDLCPLRSRHLPEELLYMNTCEECPTEYPWIDNYEIALPGGDILKKK